MKLFYFILMLSIFYIPLMQSFQTRIEKTTSSVKLPKQKIQSLESKAAHQLIKPIADASYKRISRFIKELAKKPQLPKQIISEHLTNSIIFKNTLLTPEEKINLLKEIRKNFGKKNDISDFLITLMEKDPKTINKLEQTLPKNFNLGKIEIKLPNHIDDAVYTAIEKATEDVVSYPEIKEFNLLDIATITENMNAVESILKMTSPNKLSIQENMIHIIPKGPVKILNLFIQHGAALKDTMDPDNDLLFLAALYNREDVINLLLKKGVNINEHMGEPLIASEVGALTSAAPMIGTTRLDLLQNISPLEKTPYSYDQIEQAITLLKKYGGKTALQLME